MLIQRRVDVLGGWTEEVKAIRDTDEIANVSDHASFYIFFNHWTNIIYII